MASRKSICTVLVTLAGVTALSLAYVASQGDCDIGADPASQRVYVDVDASRKTLPAGVHGKIKPPGEILVEVADAGEATGPVRLTIHATSLVPVRSAAVSIQAPQIGAEPERTESLWSSAASGIVAETFEYATAPLPAGEYRFAVVFEFVPDREDARALIVAESLCLDVRPGTVYSSTVSFDHIKRTELLQELEDRALASLKPQLARADRKTMTRERADLEARNPGAIARKIAQIKATDPDVARRIRKLNRTEDEPATPDDRARTSVKGLSETKDELPIFSSPPRGGPPAREVVVPVRLRNAQ